MIEQYYCRAMWLCGYVAMFDIFAIERFVLLILSGISSFIVYMIGLSYLQIKFFTQNLTGLKLHVVVLCIYIAIESLINPLFHLTSENALILSSVEIIMVYTITFYSRLHLFNYLKITYKQKL